MSIDPIDGSVNDKACDSVSKVKVTQPGKDVVAPIV
jgi:hypothetical protein